MLVAKLLVAATPALIAILALSAPPVAWAAPAYGPPGPEPRSRDIVALVTPLAIPPALQEAASSAMQTYPAITSARAEQSARKAELRGANWQRFPSLSVDALALRGGNQINDGDGVIANVIVEQPIWTGGRIGGTIDRARALLSAGGSAVREAQMDIGLRAVQAYYDLVAATRREAVLREGLAQHQALIDTIRRRVEQEVSPRADLELGLSRTAQVEQELAAVQSLRQASYLQLVQLVGTPAFDVGPLPAYGLQPAAGDDAVDRALACSPVIERLQFETRAARAEQKVARGLLFPQLLGQASHNEITGTRAGLALRVQTGNGLSQLAAVSSAASRIDSVMFQRLTAERELRNAMRQDLVTDRAARRRAETGGRASAASALVTDSYKRQFLAGRRTWLDVMNAVRENTSAQLSVTEAETAAMAATARLLLRSCAWQPVPPTEPPPPHGDPAGVTGDSFREGDA